MNALLQSNMTSLIFLLLFTIRVAWTGESRPEDPATNDAHTSASSSLYAHVRQWPQHELADLQLQQPCNIDRRPNLSQSEFEERYKGRMPVVLGKRISDGGALPRLASTLSHVGEAPIHARLAVGSPPPGHIISVAEHVAGFMPVYNTTGSSQSSTFAVDSDGGSAPVQPAAAEAEQRWQEYLVGPTSKNPQLTSALLKAAAQHWMRDAFAGWLALSEQEKAAKDPVPDFLSMLWTQNSSSSGRTSSTAAGLATATDDDVVDVARIARSTSCRPHLIAIGPSGIGLPFHYHEPVLGNTQLVGKKVWFVANDMSAIPGGYNHRRGTLHWATHILPQSRDGTDGAADGGIAHVYQGASNKQKKHKGGKLQKAKGVAAKSSSSAASSNAADEPVFLTCTLHPGESLYVPAGWHHATLNVGPNVNIGFGGCNDDDNGGDSRDAGEGGGGGGGGSSSAMANRRAAAGGRVDHDSVIAQQCDLYFKAVRAGKAFEFQFLDRNAARFAFQEWAVPFTDALDPLSIAKIRPYLGLRTSNAWGGMGWSGALRRLKCAVTAFPTEPEFALHYGMAMFHAAQDPSFKTGPDSPKQKNKGKSKAVAKAALSEDASAKPGAWAAWPSELHGMQPPAVPPAVNDDDASIRLTMIGQSKEHLKLAIKSNPLFPEPHAMLAIVTASEAAADAERELATSAVRLLREALTHARRAAELDSKCSEFCFLGAAIHEAEQSLNSSIAASSLARKRPTLGDTAISVARSQLLVSAAVIDEYIGCMRAVQDQLSLTAPSALWTRLASQLVQGAAIVARHSANLAAAPAFFRSGDGLVASSTLALLPADDAGEGAVTAAKKKRASTAKRSFTSPAGLPSSSPAARDPPDHELPPTRVPPAWQQSQDLHDASIRAYAALHDPAHAWMHGDGAGGSSEGEDDPEQELN